jgi:hypothetical protein
VRDIVLKYPIWQEPYRAAVIQSNPKLLKQKIAGAQQAVNELTALTDAVSIENTRRNNLG